MFNQFYKQSFKLPEPNTFIGGIGSQVNSKTLLVNWLNTETTQSDIANSNIFYFKVLGDSVAFYINRSFKIPELSESIITQNITNLVYFGYKEIKWNQLSTNSPSGSIKNLIVPNVFINMSSTFAHLNNVITPLKGVFLPKNDFFGFDFTYNSVFRDIKNNGNAIFLGNAATINSGSPDDDITYLINNKNFNVTYSQDDTEPPKVTDLNVINIGGTYIELGFAQPAHVNALKYALVFVNGFFQDVYDVNNVYASSLAKQTEYEIRIILADEYFNLSDYSNTITVTTTQITPAFTDIPATIDWQKDQFHTGDVFDETNATGIYDENDTTFEIKNVVVPQNPIGVLLESGAIGDGMAISFNNTNLVVAAGNGATLSTDTETVFVNIAHSSFQKKIVDIYVSIKPTATGKIKVWVFEADTNNLIISGQDVISDASQMGTQDVNGDWTGANAIGVGVANSIRDGVNEQPFNGTIIYGVRGYNNYLPSVF